MAGWATLLSAIFKAKIILLSLCFVCFFWGGKCCQAYKESFFTDNLNLFFPAEVLYIKCYLTLK